LRGLTPLDESEGFALDAHARRACTDTTKSRAEIEIEIEMNSTEENVVNPKVFPAVILDCADENHY
jgi:hypothetical protein